MPIVFVHGVNNRKGDGYEESQMARSAFLRKFVAPALIPASGGELEILNPYWGSDGVRFAWGMSVLPDPDVKLESFGADDFGLTPEIAASMLPEGTKKEDDIVAIARKDFSAAVELLFAAQMGSVKSSADADKLATAYASSAAYAKDDPHPAWLDKPRLNAKDFIDELGDAIRASKRETFGGLSWREKLNEGLSRLAGAIPDALNGLAAGGPRKALNSKVTRFAGDAFVYLVERERAGIESPIVAAVLKELRQADQTRKTSVTDNKLVVIAHSFGGEVMYDILTTFWPELEVDYFVTVGSQVGLFEEMKLYSASDRDFPGKVAASELRPKVKVPQNIKNWLNVVDLNDVLSFLTAPVFDRATDFKYNTGNTTLQAHGGYFERPSFYDRLGERLKSAF